MQSQDELYMREALDEAEKALPTGDVPVGAVIVKDGKVVSRGHNEKEKRKDPTAHAEILAIRHAAEALGHWRLEGSTMYVTLEPCPMCASALVLARVSRVVIGAPDPKMGACGSIFDIVRHPAVNHRLLVTHGVLEKECGEILRRFFESLRS